MFIRLEIKLDNSWWCRFLKLNWKRPKNSQKQNVVKAVMEVRGPKMDETPTLPPENSTNVIRLIPKKVHEEQKDMSQLREVFMRRQKCLFENTFAGGCKCNYCLFFNMLSLRAFDMIKSDLNNQAKKGTMVFTTQDFLDILNLTGERVISYEKSQQTPPKK